MATEMFKQTMQKLAKDFEVFRKETLNSLGEKREGEKIEFTFKDYVTQYFLFLENYDTYSDFEEDNEDNEPLEEEE